MFKGWIRQHRTCESFSETWWTRPNIIAACTSIQVQHSYCSRERETERDGRRERERARARNEMCKVKIERWKGYMWMNQCGGKELKNRKLFCLFFPLCGRRLKACTFTPSREVERCLEWWENILRFLTNTHTHLPRPIYAHTGGCLIVFKSSERSRLQSDARRDGSRKQIRRGIHTETHLIYLTKAKSKLFCIQMQMKCVSMKPP